ncbi:hypothetical protein PC110_g3652 [Phytophthora cactorum]|uniref:Uncharacterized protein n=2 Tax=Phytophthora cactorum TaxID=29920 RepID=A0A329STC3_9STRA|nr:hypothetical protein PC110_g3652 [Phytophthora cactorum]
MRVMSAQNESTATELAEISEFLLQVGKRRHEINPALGPNCIKTPKDMLVANPVEELSEYREDEDIRPGAILRGLTRLVDEMYTDINNPDIANDEYFANRTILTTTNAVVQRINEAVAQRLEELYVALSRVTSQSKFKGLIKYPQLEEEDGVYTDNI